MKTLTTAVLAGFIALVAVTTVRADDASYDDKGITLTYPKDWNIKTDAKKEFTTIVLDNKKGTSATIILHDPSIDPKTMADNLDKQYKKSFEGKIVAKSEKAAKRKLFGEERDGQTMEIELVKDTDTKTKMEFYSFKTKSNKYTITVVLTTTSFDGEGAKAIDAVTDSLKEKK